MQVKKNYSLKKHNTFCTNTKAKYFTNVKTLDQLKEILKNYPNEEILVIGDGSNTLFVNDWDGLVLKMDIKGKDIVEEDEQTVSIKIAAGENWDDFVRYTVKNNCAGIENLVMVPGTVGGAVRGNIACYGHNISDSIVSVEVFDIESGEVKSIKKKECGFLYRDSNFKKKWKKKYIIVSTVFKLNKNSKEFELSYHERAGRYGSIKEELLSFAKEPYSVHDVMKAVIRQRTKRLPSLDDWGTCGSAFENPVVSFKKFKELSEIITDLQCYPHQDLKYDIKIGGDMKFKDDDLVKIPAGRLLDELGWKGKWKKNAGVSEKHALCVVSNKMATGEEIYELLEEMKKDIQEKYGITLVSEINIIKKKEDE